jgi:maleylpyruvate isomerase
MDAALRELNDQLDLATQRLLDAARIVPEPDLRAPSLLPGWTRADVLAHLARGADAMRSLLAGARAGQQRPVHTGAREREAAAAQAPKDLMADLAASAMALRTVIRQLPDQAWSFRLKIAGAEPFPAAGLVTRRLVEVELHHCDLGIGYDASSWPPGFTEMQLPEPMRSQRQERLGYQPQTYQPTPARPDRPAAAPGPAQQRAMILRSLSGGPGLA